MPEDTNHLADEFDAYIKATMRAPTPAVIAICRSCFFAGALTYNRAIMAAGELAEDDAHLVIDALGGELLRYAKKRVARDEG